VTTTDPFHLSRVAVSKTVTAKAPKFEAKKVALSAAVTSLAAKALPAMAIVSHRTPAKRATDRGGRECRSQGKGAFQL